MAAVLGLAFLAVGLSTPAAQSDTQIKITADRLITFSKENRADFIGNVIATQGEFVITADRLQIYYRSGAMDAAPQASAEASIRKIIATGHVKIITADTLAEAERVEYQVAQALLILSGPDTRVTRGQNTVIGSKITYHRKDGRIRVERSADQRVRMLLFPEDEESAETAGRPLPVKDMVAAMEQKAVESPATDQTAGEADIQPEAGAGASASAPAAETPSETSPVTDAAEAVDSQTSVRPDLSMQAQAPPTDEEQASSGRDVTETTGAEEGRKEAPAAEAATGREGAEKTTAAEAGAEQEEAGKITVAEATVEEKGAPEATAAEATAEQHGGEKAEAAGQPGFWTKVKDTVLLTGLWRSDEPEPEAAEPTQTDSASDDTAAAKPPAAAEGGLAEQGESPKQAVAAAESVPEATPPAAPPPDDPRPSETMTLAATPTPPFEEKLEAPTAKDVEVPPEVPPAEAVSEAEEPPLQDVVTVPVGKLKKKVGFTRFDNRTFFDPERFGRLFEQSIVEPVTGANPDILFVLPGTADYARYLQSLPRNAAGRIDNLALVDLGRQQGLNAVVTGTLLDISALNEQGGLLWLKKPRLAVRMALLVAVYDVTTGMKLLDESFVHKIKVEEPVFELVRQRQMPEGPVIEKSLARLCTAAAEKISAALQAQPWKAHVSRITDERVVISSGGRAGLVPNNILAVYDMNIIKGVADQRFYLPGVQTGLVRIVDVQADSAEAVLVSGESIREGSLVQPQEGGGQGRGGVRRLIPFL